jgi:hypothetical protein
MKWLGYSGDILSQSQALPLCRLETGMNVRKGRRVTGAHDFVELKTELRACRCLASRCATGPIGCAVPGVSSATRRKVHPVYSCEVGFSEVPVMEHYRKLSTVSSPKHLYDLPLISTKRSLK